MKLREYLFSIDKSMETFAYEIKCCRETISRVILKKNKPSDRLVYKIEKATNGLVTKEDLLAEENAIQHQD